ncbi:DUF423 domain-containing protein [Paenibacillus sp. UNC499MF]|uniref:DUF423 domain-containing protein n=1 Tax=Paenibacillus sp. UNC499MF TaxID=1502751 RepID=UPI0008A0416A|nr:DUF423 domain-containing protein [Paenibacillus sp. UNC499MF]SEF94806.1 Uncharacterized membrane protein YgdD, TMEM256/DUF423 family [Paenibacillus sp. UNC499MF]
MMRLFMMLGSINMFLAVALGAFGAHMLKTKISADMLAVYQTGVQYHMIHAVGLIAIGLAADRLTQNQSLVNASGWAIVIGIILFSGSLYVMSLSGIKVLGAITPFGGVAFLTGWVLFAIAAMK